MYTLIFKTDEGIKTYKHLVVGELPIYIETLKRRNFDLLKIYNEDYFKEIEL